MINILLSVWLIWMSIFDCKNCSVPKWLIWGGGGMGLAICMVELLWKSESVVSRQEIAIAFGMGMLPGIGLLLVAYMTKAVGYGDGVVLVILGAVAGVQKAVMILTASLFLGAFCSAILLLFRMVHRKSNLPFLPFVTVGWFLVGIIG